MQASMDAGFAIAELHDEATRHNEEVEFLLSLNRDSTTSAEDKQANTEQISAEREAYFNLQDQITAAQNELDALHD